MILRSKRKQTIVLFVSFIQNSQSCWLDTPPHGTIVTYDNIAVLRSTFFLIKLYSIYIAAFVLVKALII